MSGVTAVIPCRKVDMILSAAVCVAGVISYWSQAVTRHHERSSAHGTLPPVLQHARGPRSARCAKSRSVTHA